MTPFLYGIEARELVWDLQEMLCGARVTSNYVRIGGVQREITPGFLERLSSSFVRIEELLRDFDRVVTSNRIFVDRFRNTGMLPLSKLIDYGVTGPLLRAAGVPLDLRKAEPYLVYEEIDFDVPVGTTGDRLRPLPGLPGGAGPRACASSANACR